MWHAPTIALLAVASAASPASAAGETAAVEGAAAWQRLVGNTVVAKTPTGAAYTDFYGTDGAVRHQDGDGATAGQWSQTGDTVCFDYPDDDERICVGVTVAGDAGSFTEPDGTRDTFAVLPGNPKGL